MLDDEKKMEIEILESEDTHDIELNSESDSDQENGREEETGASQSSTANTFRYRGGAQGQLTDATKLVEQTNNVRFARQVGGDERWTTDKMTIYNAVAAIANRAVQIEQSPDGKHFILEEDLERIRQDNQHLNIVLDTPLKIAFIEFITRRSPLLVYRERNDNSIEVWPIREMVPVVLNNITLDILFSQ